MRLPHLKSVLFNQINCQEMIGLQLQGYACSLCPESCSEIIEGGSKQKALEGDIFVSDCSDVCICLI